jgi:hypothetical protein
MTCWLSLVVVVARSRATVAVLVVRVVCFG